MAGGGCRKSVAKAGASRARFQPGEADHNPAKGDLGPSLERYDCNRNIDRDGAEQPGVKGQQDKYQRGQRTDHGQAGG